MAIRPPLYRPAQRSDKQRKREHDAKRRAEQPWRNWYKSKAWETARKTQLAKQPLCERHLIRGEVVPADTVNHRKPHRGNWSLFIDPANHESTCKPCHDSLIQAEEKRGFVVGSDAGGRPLDPDHPWNAR